MDSRLNHRQNHRLSLSKTRKKKSRLTTFVEWFYRFNNLPTANSRGVINFGYTYAFQHIPFVIFFMEKWVSWKEEILDQLLEGTLAYADELGQRGFSFQEYKLIISGKISDEHFDRYRVFDYLYFNDQTDRDYFTAINSNDDREVIDGYIDAITESITTEIPILKKIFFETKIPLYISIKSLRRHSYILGQSGSGKSELMKLMFYDLQRRSQNQRNRTIFLLEPHGDLSTEVLQFVLNKGQQNYKRIIYLDPFIRDTAKRLFGEDIFGADYTFTINPFDLEDQSPKQVNYLTQELSSAFFEIIQNEATTQMEAILDACIETLLYKEGSSISDLKRFMDDKRNEDLVTEGLKLRNTERKAMMERFKEDKRIIPTKSGIYYRLQKLIGDPFFRRLLVGKSTIRLEQEINKGKVIICNIAKGALGKKSANAFGKLLLSMIQGIVMKRQDLPKEKRMETFCFVDEFQNYVTPTVEQVLAESRKYALHMVLANQVIGQEMDGTMKRIILSNTAIKLAGDNNFDSLETMSKEMGKLSVEEFEKLPKFSFYLFDTFNKQGGTTLVQTPDFLVNKKPPYYMSKTELRRLFLYMVHDSGYYKRVEDTVLPTQQESNELPLIPTKSTTPKVYINDFKE